MHFLHSRTYVDNMSHCQASQSSVGFAMNHEENLTGTWTPNNFSKASYVQYQKFLTFRWMRFQETYTAGVEQLHVTLHCCHCFMLWMPEIWHSLTERLRKSLTVVMFPVGKLNYWMYSASQGSQLTDLTGRMPVCPPRVVSVFCFTYLMPSFMQICWRLVCSPDFFQTFITLVFFPGKHLAAFPALQGIVYTI